MVFDGEKCVDLVKVSFQLSSDYWDSEEAVQEREGDNSPTIVP